MSEGVRDWFISCSSHRFRSCFSFFFLLLLQITVSFLLLAWPAASIAILTVLLMGGILWEMQWSGTIFNKAHPRLRSRCDILLQIVYVNVARHGNFWLYRKHQSILYLPRLIILMEEAANCETLRQMAVAHFWPHTSIKQYFKIELTLLIGSGALSYLWCEFWPSETPTT